jgi:hypothetical protein
MLEFEISVSGHIVVWDEFGHFWVCLPMQHLNHLIVTTDLYIEEQLGQGELQAIFRFADKI